MIHFTSVASRRQGLIVCLLCGPVFATGSLYAETGTPLPLVTFLKSADAVTVLFDDRAVATYVFADAKVLRPYLKDVCTPNGVQLTRHHPPREGLDATDHADMHPGIWLAFGDLNGTDFWRNQGRVIHERFLHEATGGQGTGGFSVRNRYVSPHGDLICHEDCALTFLSRPDGYLLLWESTFVADQSFCFGDQEEMGFGVRLATPLAVKSGQSGRMLDSEGRRNEQAIWGRLATWCDCSGMLNNRFVGITIMSSPDNFRECRWHARDYGFVAANPFGRKVFNAGETSRVVVAPGKPLRLSSGFFIHSNPQESDVDLEAAYQEFLNRLKSSRP